MKKHLGRVVNRLGHEFTVEVAQTCDRLGWKCRIEVQMTEVGGSREMGDIDVLAWGKGDIVWVIECKRLQLAKTIAEVAEICSRFRGEAKDELRKHVGRANWLRQYREKLSRIVGFAPVEGSLRFLLVTSTDVPMMYLNALPIPPTDIVPFRNLEAVIADGRHESA